MKINNLMNILKMGNLSTPKFLLKNYKKLGLTSEEFIFITYLINDGHDILLDVEKIANDMGLNNHEVLNLIETLKEKDMLTVIVNKDGKKITSEYLSLDNFYNKVSLILVDYITNDNNKNNNNNVFETFEKEFGRTLSPMEYEIINAWIDSNVSNEIILEALKEATYNGVANLRYIDKIIYEWGKKGLKTVQDIKKYNTARKEKKEKVEVFNYNWLDENENE
jgi:DNA replication protein